MPPGSLRFNTDSAHLEYFRGNTIGWVEIEASTHELGGGTGSNAIDGRGTRGFCRWLYSTADEIIEFFTISTLGNSQDFGNLSHF